MSDEIDDALSEYEPTDTESDVQDTSVMMDNQVPVAEGPVDETPITASELSRIAAQPGNAPVASAAPVQPTGDPLISAQQALAMGNETANAQGGVGDAIKIQNEAKAQQLEDENVQRQLDEQENRDKQAEQDAILEKTHSEVDAAQKKYADFKFANHWRDASPANKALAIIFSAVGGAAATRTGGQNEALRAMDDITEREYKRDLADLSKQENFIKWKREGEKDLVGRFEKERSALLVQQSERLKHMANYAQSQYLRKNPGATVEEAKNSELAAGLRQKAAETYSSAVRDIYKINAQKAAALARAKQAGSGTGGGSSAALEAYYAAVNTMKPGEPITPAVAILARKANIKPNQIAADIDRIRNSGAKAEHIEGVNDAAKDKKDANVIKDPWTGVEIGTPPGQGGRMLPKFREAQSAGVQLVDNLKAYKKFLQEKGTSNWKPEDVAMAENLWASGVAQKRVWSQLPASESGIELEKAQFGGKPVAWDIKPTSLAVIDRMIHEVTDVTRQRANIMAGKPANWKPERAVAEPGKVVTIKDKAGNTHQVTMGTDGKYHSVE